MKFGQFFFIVSQTNVIQMSARAGDSSKEAIFAVLVIAGVVACLYVFHFLLKMTWMIYVIVIAAVALVFVRKMAAFKKERASATPRAS